MTFCFFCRGRFIRISFYVCVRRLKGQNSTVKDKVSYLSITPTPQCPLNTVPACFTGPGFWHGSGLITQKPKLVVLPGQDKGWHQPGTELVDWVLEVLGHSAKCSGDFDAEAMAVKWSTQRRGRPICHQPERR